MLRIPRWRIRRRNLRLRRKRSGNGAKVLARKGKVKAPCDGVIKSLSAVTGSQTGAEAAVVLYESKRNLSVSGRGQQR